MNSWSAGAFEKSPLKLVVPLEVVGSALPPGQAMTPAEALASFTLDAAYAGHQEDELGSLEPGKAADFILVEQDVFGEPASEIWKATVAETWVGGRRVASQETERSHG